MLKSVLITSSTSGLVLYQKEWVVLVEGKDMTRMLGGLMTTIQEFARQHTGMPVCYVSYDNVAVSFVFDDATGLICTLFHDIHDGAEFGRLVAGSLLTKFIDTFKIYSREGITPSPKFQTFQTKISEALEDAVSTILKKVKSQRGIRVAALVWNDDNIRVEGQLDDRIGMVANLQALLTFSNAIMQRASDGTSTITLEMSEHYVCICRLSEATLVVICRTNVDRLVYLQSINETITLVEQVMEVISNLRGEL